MYGTLLADVTFAKSIDMHSNNSHYSSMRPDRPWAKVGCDIFYMKQKRYLLTIDYFSHYPETVLLTSEASGQVCVHLKPLFTRYGIPSTVMSGGGPQFPVLSFKDLQRNGALTTTTCPSLTTLSRMVLQRTVAK